jgi:hypothetical protein
MACPLRDDRQDYKRLYPDGPISNLCYECGDFDCTHLAREFPEDCQVRTDSCKKDNEMKQKSKKDNDIYWQITPLGIISDAESMKEAILKLENFARHFYQKDGCCGAIVFGEEQGGFFASVKHKNK